MKITGLERQSLPTAMVIMLALFVCRLTGPAAAIADTYADSAHGNPTYGVNRPDTECPTGTPCPTGDCTHCHDTFDDSLCGANSLMLSYGWIDKCNLLCYECHVSEDGEMLVDNYLYSISYGGAAKTWPGVYKQFCSPACEYVNCGSRHDLVAIYNLINNDPYGWGSPPVPNPCSACHNTHLAQRVGATQHHPPYDPSKSCITRPSERYNNPSNPLWGDDSSERMDQYAGSVDGSYQAPYYGYGPRDPVTGPFEPAGDSTGDGSNLPDYVTFCLDCHQYQQYDNERDAVVGAVNWGSTGDVHGGQTANKPEDGLTVGVLRLPYSDDFPGNYVLSCTDCHEPHGTPYRQALLRRHANGTGVSGETMESYGGETWCDVTPDEARAFCGTCHTIQLDHYDSIKCFNACHFHGTTYGRF